MQSTRTGKSVGIAKFEDVKKTIMILSFLTGRRETGVDSGSMEGEDFTRLGKPSSEVDW